MKKDASIIYLGNVNDWTKELEKNKIRQSLTNEENTIIMGRLDLSAAYLIGEHARDAFKKSADANYNNDCDMKVKEMMLKELSENEYLKVKSIIDGVHITPLSKEVRAHKHREGEAPGHLEGKLTCSLSLQLRSRAEMELMRTFAKNAGFSVKDQVPKILIQQTKDQFFRIMPDIKEWWIKVDVLKGRETDVPRFRLARKKTHLVFLIADKLNIQRKARTSRHWVHPLFWHLIDL